MLKQGFEGSSDKWLIPGLEQGWYKMSLEHPVMQERKEVLENMIGHLTKTQEPVRRAPIGQIWHNLSTKIIKYSNKLQPTAQYRNLSSYYWIRKESPLDAKSGGRF